MTQRNRILWNLFFLGGALLLFTACNRLEVLEAYSNEGDYRYTADPLRSFYEQNFVFIGGWSFDSEQVSNKHLSPEMAKALALVNQWLNEPRLYLPDLAKELERHKLTQLRLASASRSPWHQKTLKNDYKADFLSSNHLFGLAVDLEMRDTCFDIKNSAKNPDSEAAYELLAQVLIRAGLVFSEPKDKDPNHVELFKFCKKKNEHWKKTELWQRKRQVLNELWRMTYFRVEDMKNRSSTPEQKQRLRQEQKLLSDLNHELSVADKILRACDPAFSFNRGLHPLWR